MALQQKFLEENNSVLLLEKAIASLALFSENESEQIFDKLEKVNNRIVINTHLGTFIYDDDNNPKFVRIGMYEKKKGEYIVNSIEQIDSDTFLDLILEKNILNTKSESIRIIV
jgi:hypothetical protein